jgi:hypothetical protein
VALQVIPTIYEKPDEFGDFGWMLKQSEYDDGFFIFNDNQEDFLAFLSDPTPGTQGCTARGGNSVIRPWQCDARPRAGGVPTGTITNGQGYPSLTPAVRHMIDGAVGVLRGTLASGNYERLFYSAANEAGDLGSGIFKDTLGEDVKKYIVEQLRGLAS